MARRHLRAGADARDGGRERPRRRWAVFSLAALAVMGACVWMAPTILVLTALRDRPLEAAFAGIDGRISSRAADWRWLGGLEYRDIVLHDRQGRAAVIVPRLVIERGLVSLALDPGDLGTVRLLGAEAVIEVRPGGSSLEDILAPWLATLAAAGPGPRISCELELVDAAVELIDTSRGAAWRLSDLLGAGTVRPDGSLAGWTVAGRLRQSAATRDTDRGGVDTAATAAAGPRLDRTTIAAGAAAVLARDGGWSIASPLPAADAAPRTMTLTAHRLPLGVSSVLATRFAGTHVLDGLADVRLDLSLDAAGPRLAGTFSGSRLAVCDAGTLAELATLERLDAPLDVSVESGRLVVRSFTMASPSFRGEASGRIRLPTGDLWQWAEGLVAEDFAVAVDCDLAAAAAAIPGGLTIRRDVRVTDGRLQLTAASRADGGDRVLEVRATSTDLAAVQRVAAADPGAAAEERPLRWTTPFSAWIRGRRGAAAGERLRIEDARFTSAAAEISATGSAGTAAVQWTLDLDKFIAEAAEVLDLAGTRLAGSSRGRIDVATTAAGTTVKATASISEFAYVVPGSPPWEDEEIVLEVDGTGVLSQGAAVVQQARAVMSAGADAVSATLTGGVVVDVSTLLGSDAAATAAPWLRPAPGGTDIAADCSVKGDLGRWHARLAGLVPAAAVPGVELGGRIDLSAAVAARGDAWQITRAGGEIETFTVRMAGRDIAEPRIMLTAAGMVHPARGQLDLSSAEALSATLSLRTGGLSWMPATREATSAGDAILERLRGKLQWQADVGRIERWLVPAETATRWPAAGRAWGTLELLDAQAGVNLLIEASGSQLSLSTGGERAAGQPPRPLWNEPRASCILEVTRPFGAAGEFADRIDIERLAVESSTVAVAARGAVGDWSTRRLVALDGNVSYDWQQLSRLLTPWTGGRLAVAGSGGRPFTFRGPLGRLPDAPAAEEAAAGRLASAAAARDGLADQLRGFSVDTSAAWTAAEFDGLPVAAGEMTVRLFEGQLAFGPFDLAAAGGRIRGAPWIRLSPAPAELVLPPGRCLERVTLSGAQCGRWTTMLSPILGQSTQTEGVVSVDLAGGRLPLADPFAGELAGQVIFDRFEVTPGPGVQPLANLIAKLQTVIDPRFAFGDKVVLLRVRPDPIRIRLTGRRLWHEGLVMDAGQLAVRSAGSVAASGELDMVVEVAFRGDIAGSTPVVSRLLRTPLAIPLKGTMQRPQFDARAIDMVLGRIVENTAEAVITDGIGRGLEAIFSPPPPTP